MGMVVEVTEAVTAIQAVVRSLDPECLTAADAERLVTVFAKGERVCAAGKALAARRVKSSGSWKKSGSRSPAEWLAKQSGSSVTTAAKDLETAERCEGLPGVDAALRDGELSPAQASEIASAGAADPDAEADLLETAKTEGMAGLRQACQRVRAAADDDRERAQRLHRRRSLRTWTDQEGAGHLHARLCPENLAQVVASLRPFEVEELARARGEKRYEPYEALRADAFVEMARNSHCPRSSSGGASDGGRSPGHAGGGPTPGPNGGGGGGSGNGGGDRERAPAQVILLVEAAALLRGSVEGDERCEIDGVGPVPVTVARSLIGDAALAAVIRDGVDIRNVTHLGRHPTAHQRTALRARDPECVVPGCHARHGLEIDHVDPWVPSYVTKLDLLARLCRHHHLLKTYRGWRLTGEPGNWQFLPPPDGSNTNGSGAERSAPERPPPPPTPGGAPSRRNDRDQQTLID